MLEGELLVAADPRHRLATDEIARLEDGQRVVDAVAVGEGFDDTAPERLPDHGRRQERRPRVGGKRIDPRRDRLAHRYG